MSIRAGPAKIVVPAVFLFLFLMATASAACPETKLKVLPSEVTTTNPGALTPGMAVVMSVRVDFPDKENSTYPETNQLELTSGLDNPAWTWNIVRNGIKKDETEERKSRVIISGDVLSWPANVTESLEVELYGIAPSVMETKNLTVLRIQDLAGPTCVNNPVYQYNAFVLNTTVTNERIGSLNAELAQVRTDAAAKNRTGAGSPGILEKIDEAQQALDEANSTPALEFVSVALALNRTESAIADGRRLLADVPVSVTMLPQQEGAAVRNTMPGTTGPAPASAGLFPLLTAIIACAGAGIVLGRDRR